jgi:hypothetical protein
MKHRVPVIIIAVAAVAVLLGLILSNQRPVANARSLTENAARGVASPQLRADPARTDLHGEHDDTSSDTSAPNATSTLPGPVPAPTKHLALAAAAQPPVGPEVGPGLTPITVMENIRSVFRQYNQRFGGNPVGNNSEITAALNGANSRQVVFINPEDGMRINERGQLVDNWGTPFFFHQISGTEMEIRSAGPDRKMWTADDLVIK